MNQEYVESLEKKLKEYEEVILDMTAPIIPSIIPSTILVPITGILFEQRFENIRIKILTYLQNHSVESAIIDFTDITLDKIENLDMEDLGRELHQLTEAIILMGVEPFYVGLSPQLIKKIVISGIQIKAESFSTFSVALKYLMEKKGLAFAEN
ncbi:hypothetical protein [Bacillus weihaiensis]|uniref:STAS domain-containing protein n=1 Tax=Bacillus weihaiensis TaxID=1547283 RepID=A0A1L3MUS5_9BACI|nr:hypothetical protein [Bacillus weihaiensis]APH06074.1 hypothetical protein A9C19_15730 [Bacillus weihaiensis]